MCSNPSWWKVTQKSSRIQNNGRIKPENKDLKIRQTRSRLNTGANTGNRKSDNKSENTRGRWGETLGTGIHSFYSPPSFVFTKTAHLLWLLLHQSPSCTSVLMLHGLCVLNLSSQEELKVSHSPFISFPFSSVQFYSAFHFITVTPFGAGLQQNSSNKAQQIPKSHKLLAKVHRAGQVHKMAM